MGLFGKKEKKIILPDNAKCCRCRKKIRKSDPYSVIDGKLYCKKCADAERDWRLLELIEILDDD